MPIHYVARAGERIAQAIGVGTRPARMPQGATWTSPAPRPAGTNQPGS